MSKLIKLFTRYGLSFGMISVIIYIFHLILGDLLWKEYNPITTDISSLTANGAPNADLLRIFTTVYGILLLLFIINMVIKAYKEYHLMVRIGYIFLFIMSFTSLIGYALFPLEGDKTIMTYQNMMHIIVTIIVVFTSIVSGFLLSFGYMRQENLKHIGKILLIFAILITAFGLLNPITMANNWQILGLTERLVNYTLHTMIFYLSYLYTFQNVGAK